jgi:hypothetical protein
MQGWQKPDFVKRGLEGFWFKPVKQNFWTLASWHFQTIIMYNFMLFVLQQ